MTSTYVCAIRMTVSGMIYALTLSSGSASTWPQGPVCQYCRFARRGEWNMHTLRMSATMNRDAQQCCEHLTDSRYRESLVPCSKRAAAWSRCSNHTRLQHPTAPCIPSTVANCYLFWSCLRCYMQLCLPRGSHQDFRDTGVDVVQPSCNAENPRSSSNSAERMKRGLLHTHLSERSASTCLSCRVVIEKTVGMSGLT